MSELVTYEVHERSAVVTVNNPPVNALSVGVPQGIAAAVERANSDSNVDKVVLIGAGRGFIAGADINDFVKMQAENSPIRKLHPMLYAIEDSAKPVIAAIHGQALGGGLEVAMACHYRIAVASAYVGQPEVNLGIIPGAGGTQRLPRLVGIERAAEMCALGEPLKATKAYELGLIDKIADGDLLQAALAVDARPAKTRDRNDKLTPVDLSDIRAKVAAVRPNESAPLAAIDCVEATARLPFFEGIEKEREVFERCVRSEQAAALIHVFFGERAVSKAPCAARSTLELKFTPGRIPETDAVGVDFGEAPHRLMEIVRGPNTSDETVATALAYAKSIKRIGVVTRGLVGRRLRANPADAQRILDEGLAARPVDIDIICVAGYGYPAYLGGPLFAARPR